MNRQKNSSLWHLLCLALLLCMAFAVIATGTAYARYRTDAKAELLFEIRKPAELVIGTVINVDGNEEFNPEGIQEWKIEGNTATLEIAVSNGTNSVQAKDQKVRLRLIGGIGLTVGEETAEIINRTKANGGRVFAVGTTCCRTLESVASFRGKICEDEGWTNIFIYPGYEFKCIDCLITNFHLPESTLIMLVSAFCGYENTMNAYKIAVEEKYRFFSFGDSCVFYGD